MGTRADFYIGRGPSAEWLGSVGWDGYEWQHSRSFLRRCKTAEAFRAAVAKIQRERQDFTTPEEGWPWPWDDSNTTDLAYVFDEGKVIVPDRAVNWFPSMAARRNVQWGAKSGLTTVSSK